jgi:hypothetical protein
MKFWVLLVSIFGLIACNATTAKNKKPARATVMLQNKNYDTSINVVHIMVALCDNKYQGIQPVPAKIGNGQDKENNLYWGCSYGIRSFFKNSKDWTLVKQFKKDSIILERIVFKHKTKNYYLVADAYDGKEIKQCTKDFLQSCAGNRKDTFAINGKSIGINGNAKLLSYIGHDGLMEFKLDENFKNTDGKKRDAIILACISKNYFAPYLKQTTANPLVWTTGLMAPEAYTVHDAINAYIDNKSNTAIQQAAAGAYAKYQKCSIKAANNLLVTGW